MPFNFGVVPGILYSDGSVPDTGSDYKTLAKTAAKALANEIKVKPPFV